MQPTLASRGGRGEPVRLLTSRGDQSGMAGCACTDLVTAGGRPRAQGVHRYRRLPGAVHALFVEAAQRHRPARARPGALGVSSARSSQERARHSAARTRSRPRRTRPGRSSPAVGELAGSTGAPAFIVGAARVIRGQRTRAAVSQRGEGARAARAVCAAARGRRGEVPGAAHTLRHCGAEALRVSAVLADDWARVAARAGLARVSRIRLLRWATRG